MRARAKTRLLIPKGKESRRKKVHSVWSVHVAISSCGHRIPSASASMVSLLSAGSHQRGYVALAGHKIQWDLWRGTPWRGLRGDKTSLNSQDFHFELHDIGRAAERCRLVGTVESMPYRWRGRAVVPPAYAFFVGDPLLPLTIQIIGPWEGKSRHRVVSKAKSGLGRLEFLIRMTRHQSCFAIVPPGMRRGTREGTQAPSILAGADSSLSVRRLRPGAGSFARLLILYPCIGISSAT